MKDEAQVMLLIPKGEWNEMKTKIDEILIGQRKDASPLAAYITKEQLMTTFNISPRTFHRLKSQGKINTKKLGGKQLFLIDEITRLIESNVEV